MSTDFIFGILPKGLFSPSQLIYRRRVSKTDPSDKSKDAGEDRGESYEYSDEAAVAMRKSTYFEKERRGRGSELLDEEA